jgi:hypothetical protein
MKTEKIVGGGPEGLGLAILLQAVEDSQSSNGVAHNARSFLHSQGCKWLLSFLDIGQEAWHRVMSEAVPAGDYQLDLL